MGIIELVSLVLRVFSQCVVPEVEMYAQSCLFVPTVRVGLYAHFLLLCFGVTVCLIKLINIREILLHTIMALCCILLNMLRRAENA